MTGNTTLLWFRRGSSVPDKHIFANTPRDSSYWGDVPPFPGLEHLPLVPFGLCSGLVYDSSLTVVPFTIHSSAEDSVDQVRSFRLNPTLLRSTFPGRIMWLFTTDREQLPELAMRQLSSALQRLPDAVEKRLFLRWVVDDYATHEETHKITGLWWRLWYTWPDAPLQECMCRLSRDEMGVSTSCGYVFTDISEKVVCEQF